MGDRVRRRGARIAVVVAGAVALVVLVAVAVDVGRLGARLGRVDVAVPGSGGGGTTYLLVGSDSRRAAPSGPGPDSYGTPEQSPDVNADVLMLLRVPDTGAPTLLAVPRDLVVPVPGVGPRRITRALQQGPDTLVRTVCRSLGVGVDHVVVADFEGVARLVDEVGGIEVTAAVPAKDESVGIDFPTPGTYTLDGRRTLAYLRGRHPLVLTPDGWIPLPGGPSRMQHARLVAGQLAADIRSTRNPLRLRDLAWTGASSLSVDPATGLGDLRNLAGAMDAALGGGDGARAVDLPMAERDDELGSGVLDAASVAALESVGAGRNPSCPTPTADPAGAAPAEPSWPGPTTVEGAGRGPGPGVGPTAPPVPR